MREHTVHLLPQCLAGQRGLNVPDAVLLPGIEVAAMLSEMREVIRVDELLSPSRFDAGGSALTRSLVNNSCHRYSSFIMFVYI